MYLNHPETSPVRGKIIFHETSIWCQGGWGPLFWRMSLDAEGQQVTGTRLPNNSINANEQFLVTSVPGTILGACDTSMTKPTTKNAN